VVGDREATMVRVFNGLNREIANIVEYLTLCEGWRHGSYGYESGETTQKEITWSASISGSSSSWKLNLRRERDA